MVEKRLGKYHLKENNFRGKNHLFHICQSPASHCPSPPTAPHLPQPHPLSPLTLTSAILQYLGSHVSVYSNSCFFPWTLFLISAEDITVQFEAILLIDHILMYSTNVARSVIYVPSYLQR